MKTRPLSISLLPLLFLQYTLVFKCTPFPILITDLRSEWTEIKPWWGGIFVQITNSRHREVPQGSTTRYSSLGFSQKRGY